eukprot:m.343270 g.343270  ORF g.343270 m.343270 type:complete len:608 (+) comp22641_c0_seq1:72-1895(+)
MSLMNIILFSATTLVQAQPEGFQLISIEFDSSSSSNNISAVNVQGLYPGETVTVSSQLLHTRRLIGNSYLPSSTHIHSNLGSLLIHTGEQISHHDIGGSLIEEVSLPQKYQELWNIDDKNYIGISYDVDASVNKLWHVTNAATDVFRGLVDLSPNLGYLPEGCFVDVDNNYMYILATGGGVAARYLVYDYTTGSNSTVATFTINIIALKAWHETSTTAIVLGKGFTLFRVSLTDGTDTIITQLSFGDGFSINTVSSFLDQHGYLYILYTNSSSDHYLVYDVNSNIEYRNVELGMKRQVYYLVNAQHTTETTTATTITATATSTLTSTTRTTITSSTRTSTTTITSSTVSSTTTETTSTITSSTISLTTSTITATSTTATSTSSTVTTSTVSTITTTSTSTTVTTTSSTASSTTSSPTATSTTSFTLSTLSSSTTSSSSTTMTIVTTITSTTTSTTTTSSTISSYCPHNNTQHFKSPFNARGYKNVDGITVTSYYVVVGVNLLECADLCINNGTMCKAFQYRATNSRCELLWANSTFQNFPSSNWEMFDRNLFCYGATTTSTTSTSSSRIRGCNRALRLRQQQTLSCSKPAQRVPRGISADSNLSSVI